jgi:DNA-binding LytR/AlgR family response regulator
LNTKLKCLLLDDELPALSYLKVVCEQITGVEVVRAFNDPVKFLEAIPQLDFNTCVLDIQMPGLSGMEVAKYLNSKLIIFTTAHKDFAAEAFDLNAVDYIRKPVQKERLERAIAKAKTLLEKNETADKQQFIWNTDKGKTVVPIRKIIYITSSETDSRDKLFVLDDGQKLIVKNIGFEQILSLLPPEHFCRINKKDIISIKTVIHFTSDEINTNIVLKNTVLSLPLSDVYKNNFRLRIGP